MNYYDNLAAREKMVQEDGTHGHLSYGSIWYVKGTNSIDFKITKNINSSTNYFLYLTAFNCTEAFLYHLLGRFKYDNYILIKNFLYKKDFSKSTRIA
jgi:hypothetical protein